VYDSRKPEFDGKLNLTVEYTINDTYVIAQWNKNGFTNHGDVDGLSFEVAIGI
jgi:hypothetical protein